MNRGRALFGAALLLLAVSAEAADVPMLSHEGRTYVELSRVAEKLGTKLDATAASIRARIRTTDHAVTFTRNWAQIVVDGKIFVLEAPVRVRHGAWLVPQSFLVRVLPGLTRRPAVASSSSAPSTPAPSSVAPPVAPSSTASLPASAALVAPAPVAPVDPVPPPIVVAAIPSQPGPPAAPVIPAPPAVPSPPTATAKPASTPAVMTTMPVPPALAPTPPAPPTAAPAPALRPTASVPAAPPATAVPPVPGPTARSAPAAAAATALAPTPPAHRPVAPAPVATASPARSATAAPPAVPPPSPPVVPPSPSATAKPASAQTVMMTAPAPAPSAASPRTTPSATGVTLDEMRLRSYPSFTRVVLETSSPVTYAIEARGPAMARVKLPALVSEPRHEQVRDGYVDEVRLDRVGADLVLRVTFEGEAGDIRVGTLSDPPRLVLDFVRPGQQETSRRPAGIGPLKTIVLDAGHGGHDSGAVGPTGLMEKELVLDITKRVAKLIDQRLDMKVRLSRGTDNFVTLKDRTSFANKERADLFVSIHANAHREVASEGVETYFLSSEATDNAARQVAALENGVVQLEKPGPRGRDIVKSILWDLAQSEFQEESSQLAEVVLDSMTQTLRIPNRGVKQAGFYVLGGAAMPAVLIEIGFVTNPREEKKLRDSKYRDEIAKAIFEGIAEYKVRWSQRSKTALDGSR